MAVTLTYVMLYFAAIIRIDVNERGIKLKMHLINRFGQMNHLSESERSQGKS